jgi:hypothetical protein
LVINVDGRGRLLLQTVWEIDGDPHGRRRTDIETVASLEKLLARLAELALLLFPPETVPDIRYGPIEPLAAAV